MSSLLLVVKQGSRAFYIERRWLAAAIYILLSGDRRPNTVCRALLAPSVAQGEVTARSWPVLFLGLSESGEVNRYMAARRSAENGFQPIPLRQKMTRILAAVVLVVLALSAIGSADAAKKKEDPKHCEASPIFRL